MEYNKGDKINFAILGVGDLCEGIATTTFVKSNKKSYTVTDKTLGNINVSEKDNYFLDREKQYYTLTMRDKYKDIISYTAIIVSEEDIPELLVQSKLVAEYNRCNKMSEYGGSRYHIRSEERNLQETEKLNKQKDKIDAEIKKLQDEISRVKEYTVKKQECKEKINKYLDEHGMDRPRGWG